MGKHIIFRELNVLRNLKIMNFRSSNVQYPDLHIFHCLTVVCPNFLGKMLIFELMVKQMTVSYLSLSGISKLGNFWLLECPEPGSSYF